MYDPLLHKCERRIFKDESGTTTSNTEDIYASKAYARERLANKASDTSENEEALEMDDSGRWLEALLSTFLRQSGAETLTRRDLQGPCSGVDCGDRSACKDSMRLTCEWRERERMLSLMLS